MVNMFVHLWLYLLQSVNPILEGIKLEVMLGCIIDNAEINS
jgi:hypothetical protein